MSTTSFHQGLLGFSLPASSALFIDIFNNSEKSYFKCTGQNSPPGLKNKSCHVWQTAAHRRQTSNIYIQICKFKESIGTAYSLFSFFIWKEKLVRNIIIILPYWFPCGKEHPMRHAPGISFPPRVKVSLLPRRLFLHDQKCLMESWFAGLGSNLARPVFLLLLNTGGT